MVKLHGAVLPPLITFPSSPDQGRLAFVNDILYVFKEVDGTNSWYPMTNRTRRHIHNQASGSISWVIVHGLNTQQLIVICYDSSDNLITPSNVVYDNDNQITVTFGSSQTGNCAIFIDVSEELTSAASPTQILDGNSSLVVADTGTGDIKGTVDAIDVFDLTSTLQRIGKDVSSSKIEITATEVKFFDPSGNKFQTSPTGMSVFGSIAVSGTVDGRDIAFDGTKLDGIEAGADVNNLVTAEAAELTGGDATILHKHDHGNMDGLGDDDHSIYSLADGSRAYTGGIPGVTPTIGGHLATKDYVDGLVSGLDWQQSVLDQDLNTPPPLPGTGDRYLVSTAPPTATGAWVGHDNELAEYNGSSWDFTAVSEGMACWVEDEDIVYNYNGTTWVKFGSTITHNNMSGLNDGDYKHLTAAEKTRLDGIETGAEVNNISDVNASALIGGAVTTLHEHGSLYHTTTEVAKAMNDGTSVGAGIHLDGPHGSAKIATATDAFYLWSEEDGSLIEIGGYNDSTVYKPCIQMDPNGSTALDYAGIAKIQTLGTGAWLDGAREINLNAAGGFISIKGDSGGWATGLNFLDGSGNNEGGYWALGSGDALTYFGIGKAYNDTGIKVYPDAQVEISHNNSPHMITYGGGGIKVISANALKESYVYPDAAGGTYLQNGTPGAVTYFYNINTNPSGRYLVFAPNTASFYPGATNAYNLGLSGLAWHTVYAYTGTIQSSDERKKENIIASDLGLDFINDLNPVSFKFKDYDYENVDPISGETENGTMEHHRTHYGLISQEVLATLTAHGKTTEQFAGYINDEENDYFGLRYQEFVSPMIKSVQELSTLANTQQAVIDGLTSRIEALEA